MSKAAIKTDANRQDRELLTSPEAENSTLWESRVASVLHVL